MYGAKFPLAYGKMAMITTSCGEEEARRCDLRFLDEAKGKILVCDGIVDGESVTEVGAVGLIGFVDLDDPKVSDDPIVSNIPMSGLKHDDYQTLLSYINSTEHNL
ncbi:PREDICTED: subtilisin-like protease SBT4.4 isoform X2 [Tarenaya hassleriana]|uniref:subtilisin-like protease SBT4.4 isoform X2 n=1 Tax=Tarenaya hassleriana TaxID=28532 RepID=UPI00053C0FB1|nr:PREDICTED: subtilisin-like protease SBT4.4 isoform X2 [Tarenaya hassleriana]